MNEFSSDTKHSENDNLNSKIVLYLLLAALAVGAVLRLAWLTERGLSFDECLEIALVERYFQTSFEPTAEGAMFEQPTYFVLASGWAVIFGTGDFSIRLLNVLFGLATIFLTYKLAESLLGRKVALITAWLAALSPFMIFYSRIARIYSLFALLTVASAYLFIESLRGGKEGGRRRWVLYVAVTTMLIYTHYYAFFVLFFQGIYFVSFWRIHRPRLKTCLLSWSAVALLYVPWLPMFWMHFSRSSVNVIGGDPWPVPFGAAGKIAFTLYTFGVGMTVLPWYFWIVVPAAVAFGVAFFAGAHTLYKDNKQVLVFLTLMIFVPLVVVSVIGYSMPRYFHNIVAGFYILVAAGIVRLLEIRKAVPGLAAGGIICFVFVASLFNYYGGRQFINMAYVEPWREVATLVEKESRKGDLIAHSFAINPCFERYYKGELRSIYPYGNFMDEQLCKLVKDGRRVWFIRYSSGLSADKSGDFVDFLSQHYVRERVWRFLKDEEVENKRKYARKHFVDYRIMVELHVPKQ